MPRLSEPSPYVEFDRKQWRALRKSTPLVLTEEELIGLRGLGEQIDLTEVAEVYLPLARLIHLQVAARQRLFAATATFLGDQHPDRLVPFVIGVAGSVAVGKSTTARVLQALLARWDHHPRVDLVTTDGFLYPNAEPATQHHAPQGVSLKVTTDAGCCGSSPRSNRARGKSPRRCTRTCCTTSSRTRNMLYSNPISSFLRA